ncbi:MAG TPA: hypothetical protein DIT13_01705 [Verrucomicrobiales bacterium]|nr:hypothetical protein [Verrucomicrobiales bacterium]HRJ07511.1 nucleotidyl transferase AbiEii/AbiGii toxin family protein [Prosthecobacter sp.]HRK12757.1 nucleotidyl transferase AbiEii/AbiGii toxin family protein [Prosthecobacter sp.]
MNAHPESILHAAESVVAVLKEFQTEAVVIGALALAAHHYVRFTEDLDLGMNASAQKFRAIAEALRARGFHVELREPDADDPLSGVMDVMCPGGLIQLVNFGQTFPAVIEDALQAPPLTVRPESALRVVPLPHLVALKLYAGGFKSKADVVELLRRNTDADRDEILALCKRYRLRGLPELLEEAGK